MPGARSAIEPACRSHVGAGLFIFDAPISASCLAMQTRALPPPRLRSGAVGLATSPLGKIYIHCRRRPSSIVQRQAPGWLRLRLSSLMRSVQVHWLGSMSAPSHGMWRPVGGLGAARRLVVAGSLLRRPGSCFATLLSYRGHTHTHDGSHRTARMLFQGKTHPRVCECIIHVCINKRNTQSA